MNPLTTPPRLLTIAGSDSGGGAGIQADLKTFEAFGCFGMSAITVLTAQNTLGVQDIYPVTPSFVSTQIDSILNDIGVDAVKIGMLYSREIIEAVSQSISKYDFQNLIVDPVMIAKGGNRLLREDSISAIKNQILPKASLITPNLEEAQVLTGTRIIDLTSMRSALNQLLEYSPHVLLKGGHLQTDHSVHDFYASRDGLTFSLEHPRIHSRNTHGTGCTLSAAIAALVAQGLDWKSAIVQARIYLQGAIAAHSTSTLGKGNGPLKHSYLNSGVKR